jgi:hypothetical protein
MGLRGPLGEEGVPPLGLGAKGWGPTPPWPAHPSPLGGLVPHGGGKRDHTPPWPLYRGVDPPFSIQQLISFFFLLHFRKWTPLVWSLHQDWSSPP